MTGDVVDRRMDVIGDNVECPSLSPDEQRLVFKNRVTGSRAWRLHARDLPSGRTWPIAETRSVDDQAEWLDNGHVLYQLVENRGLPEDAVHVWKSTDWQRRLARHRLFTSGRRPLRQSSFRKGSDTAGLCNFRPPTR